MEIEIRDNKVIIEIDRKYFDYSIIDFINKFENEKKNKNLFLDFALKHQGELKDEDIASEEELHMQGD